MQPNSCLNCSQSSNRVTTAKVLLAKSLGHSSLLTQFFQKDKTEKNPTERFGLENKKLDSWKFLDV